MSINVLECNLQEIYASGHSGANLVSDISGTYLYSSNAGWGIFWSWVFNIAKFLDIEDLQKNRFELAMTFTHRLFREHFTKAVESSLAYQEYMRKKVLDDDVPDACIAQDRQRIVSWYKAVKPFIKFSKNNCPESLKNSFTLGFTNLVSEIYNSPLSEGLYGYQLEKQRHLVKLEGIIKAPLPVRIFLKAAEKSPLTNSEQKMLKKFVKKLNKNQCHIGIKNLHKALQNTIADENEKKISKGKELLDITNLEISLANLDCRRFLNKDNRHIQKRNLLKPGDTIRCNGREYILGERLGGKAKQDDQNIVFATDDPTIVLSIGINSRVHHFKRALAAQEGWGIKSADYIDIDDKSGYALIERLYDHLGSFVWTSNSDTIDSTDEEIAMPLWKSLQWFLSQKKTPLNFSPQYLMFDYQGFLKCIKVPLRGELDFNALVKFAYECSAGNPTIYRYLMLKSGLSSHPYAQYYEEMMKYALSNQKHAAEDVAAARGIIDNLIVRKAKNLVLEVEKLNESCRAKIKSVSSFEITNLDQLLSEEIINGYCKSATAGLLPSFLEKEIVEKCLHK